jgi:hypothetical protein
MMITGLADPHDHQVKLKKPNEVELLNQQQLRQIELPNQVYLVSITFSLCLLVISKCVFSAKTSHETSREPKQSMW